MQKVLIVCSMVAAMFLSLINPGTSYAAENPPKLTPVLAGMSGIGKYTNNPWDNYPDTVVKSMTDGNLSTYAEFFTNMQTVKFPLAEEKTIYAFKAKATADGNYTNFLLNLYDENRKLLLSKNITKPNVANNTLINLDTPISHVKFVSIQFQLAYDYYRNPFYELEVYSYDVDNTPPNKPQGLKTTGTNGFIHLSWNNNTETDMSGYNVYLSDGTKVNTGLIETNKYDYPSPNDIEKSFYITAVDTSGNESIPSDAVKGMAMLRPPSQPQGLKAQEIKVGGAKVAMISWKEDKDVKGYNLYVSRDGKDYEKIGKDLIKDPSYAYKDVEEKKTYYFRLEAVNDDGASKAAETSIKISGPPVTESGQEETNEYMLVTWKATDNAVGYQIYLNGRQVGSVGPNVFSFKITKAMGYIPGGLVNKSEVKAVFADGSTGESDNKDKPGSGGGLEDQLNFLDVKDMIVTAIGFLMIYKLWILLVLAVVFSPVLYGLVVKLVNYLGQRYAMNQRRR